jgi:pilus assembly protein Flp/PilA
VFTVFRELARDQDGATLVEYGLVVGLISGVAIVVLSALGNSVAGIFSKILDAFKPLS